MRNPKLFAILVGSAFCLLMPSIQPIWAAEANGLHVGVAKVDITPTNLINVNPMGKGTFNDVHDPIYARALIIDNGHNTVALVSLDLIETGSTMEVRERIQKELGIPVNHIIIATTHDHSAPRLGRPTPGSKTKAGGPEIDAFTDVVNDKIVAALKQAKATMQPARLGLGTGGADVSVNREQFTPPQGYRDGFNAAGVSDKTVWVVKFETLTGTPIALLFNYAVHSVVTMQEGRLSGDLAGAAEHYVEQHYGDKVVALWTLGSAGDQFPKFWGGAAGAGGARGQGGPGGPAPAGSATASVKGQVPDAYDAMNAQGFMVGAEVVRVANLIQPNISSAKVEGDETVFTCPLKEGVTKDASFHETTTGTGRYVSV